MQNAAIASDGYVAYAPSILYIHITPSCYRSAMNLLNPATTWGPYRAKVHRDLKPLNLLLTKYLEVLRHALAYEHNAMHTMQDMQEPSHQNSSYLFMLYVPCGHSRCSIFSDLISMKWSARWHYACTMSRSLRQSTPVRRSKLQTWALRESWLGQGPQGPQGPSQVMARRQG